MSIVDNHGRPVNYLRLAVTDRCNLRCFYCMPEEGISFAPRNSLLTFEEMLRICTLMHSMGITKVRITGGEPFLRKDLMYFLRQLSSVGFEQISITTNGTLLMRHIDELYDLGIRSINFSLDTTNSKRFHQITRRDQFEEVWTTLMTLLDKQFQLKVNMVVMEGINDMDIVPMAELAKDYPLSVRFIEEMPFNGGGSFQAIKWTHHAILEELENALGHLEAQDFLHGSTAQTYKLNEFKGDLGIIAAYTRSFCGSCNRVRVTPQGALKTCLYDHGVFSLRDLIRSNANDDQLRQAIQEACNQRAKNGHEAEQNRFKSSTGFESMATIGG